VQACFDTLLRAIDAGAKSLRSGVAHWQVDQVARSVLLEAGYEELQFAFGHHLGRTAHDGGILGPRCERYGNTPERIVEANNVFALKFAIPCPESGHGWISLEEDMLVGEHGVTWPSRPQRALRLITK
jgi:Xaa-Pro aminopeptidase